MLKVMIIGAGGIAPAHIKGYQSFPELVKIAVIANPTLERAHKLISEYKLEAVGTDHYEKWLSEVDIVSICTPPETHRDIAVKALDAGTHVLLEKPMARSLEECDEILAAAENSGTKLSIVAQSRFISSINKVISLIHEKKYGRLLFSQVNSFWYRGQNYYDLYWRGLWNKEGGGCTLNHGVHHIDLLIWAKGMPQEIISVLSNLNHDNSEEEDISLSILKYTDGTLGQINCSLIHHGEVQKLDFQMEKGSISIPYEIRANSSRSNGFPLENEQLESDMDANFNSIPGLEYEHHTGQIENFLGSILTRSPLLIDGNEGRKSIELITGIYKSAFTGLPVKLPLSKEDSYYSFNGRIADAVRFNQKGRIVRSFEDSSITSFEGKF